MSDEGVDSDSSNGSPDVMAIQEKGSCTCSSTSHDTHCAWFGNMPQIRFDNVAERVGEIYLRRIACFAARAVGEGVHGPYLVGGVMGW